jgi:hypothetical protein
MQVNAKGIAICYGGNRGRAPEPRMRGTAEGLERRRELLSREAIRLAVGFCSKFKSPALRRGHEVECYGRIDEMQLAHQLATEHSCNRYQSRTQETQSSGLRCA